MLTGAGPGALGRGAGLPGLSKPPGPVLRVTLGLLLRGAIGRGRVRGAVAIRVGCRGG